LLILTKAISFLKNKLTLSTMIALIWCCVIHLSWTFACQALCIQRLIAGNVFVFERLRTFL